jgi:hypothetical protein
MFCLIAVLLLPVLIQNFTLKKLSSAMRRRMIWYKFTKVSEEPDDSGLVNMPGYMESLPRRLRFVATVIKTSSTNHYDPKLNGIGKVHRTIIELEHIKLKTGDACCSWRVNKNWPVAFL